MAKQLATVAPTADEINIFNDEFDVMLQVQFPERDLRTPFITNRDYILYGLTVAKDSPGGTFGGRGARGGQLGWEVTRPETVRSSSNRNWKQTGVSAGWTNLFGTSSAEVQIHEDALLCTVGMIDYHTSPKLVQVKPHVLGDDLNIEQLLIPFRKGVGIHTFSYPWMVPPKNYFYMRGLYDTAGDDEPGLLAVTYAKASYLQNESASTQSGGT